MGKHLFRAPMIVYKKLFTSSVFRAHQLKNNKIVVKTTVSKLLLNIVFIDYNDFHKHFVTVTNITTEVP